MKQEVIKNSPPNPLSFPKERGRLSLPFSEGMGDELNEMTILQEAIFSQQVGGLNLFPALNYHIHVSKNFCHGICVYEPETMKEIIQLENISFSYGRVQAVRDLSLTLAGGVFGLLGPNGAGKTTLLKLLLGFLTPTAGRGEIMGYALAAKHKSLRQAIGYMPESDCSIPGMDAVSLTAYLGELSGMPRQEAMKRAHDVLYYVGLDESRYRLVDTYSTGMKQRLKLAQALVHDPKLLLLDEPTSGMDPVGRKEMLELIQDIAKKESMNIIISSHLLPDIESTCRQVVIMNQGRIAAEESIAGLKKDNFRLFEIKVVGTQELFFERLRTWRCQVQENEKAMFKVLLPAEISPAALFDAAHATGVQIRHFRQSKTTLEDAFMNVIRESDGH